MNFQRTANSVLTVCLTSGGRFKYTQPTIRIHWITVEIAQEKRVEDGVITMWYDTRPLAQKNAVRS